RRGRGWVGRGDASAATCAGFGRGGGPLPRLDDVGGTRRAVPSWSAPRGSHGARGRGAVWGGPNRRCRTSVAAVAAGVPSLGAAQGDVVYAMKRAHAALVGVLGVGCLAETSIPIGRYEGDSAEMVATGTVDEPPPSEDPSVASDDEGGQEGLGTKMARDGSTCETAAMCSVAAACQTASCAQDRQCVVALDDDACPEGQACLLAGCRVPTPPCEERYGDAVVFCDDFELGIAWAWSSADGVLLEHAAERDS